MNDEKLRAIYDARVAADAPSNRAECPSPETLQQLSAGPKGGAEPDLALLDHVFSCAHCRSEIAMLRAVHAETIAKDLNAEVHLPAMPVISDRDQLSAAGQKAKRRWFATPRIAAVAAVLVVIAVASQALRGPSDSEVVRDAADHTDVTVVSPAANGELGADAPFIWHGVSGTVTYEIQILDTAGAVVATEITPDTVYAPNAEIRARLDASGVVDWFVAARRSDGNERRSPVTRVRIVAR